MASVATISSRDEVIGDLLAEAFDKVGKDGVITVEESNTMGTELEFTEGMQFDKGYISAVLRDRPGADGDRPRRPLHPAAPGQDLVGRRPAPAAGEGHRRRQAALHPRRGRRRRGAVDPGRQQDPRHLQRRRGEGSGVRRPPQGDDAGHRDPDRWPDRRPRGRPQARPGRSRGAGPGPARRDHQGRHHDRRRRRRRRRGRGPRQPDQGRDRERPTPTGTARSSRSASPSSPVASA